MQQPNPQWPWSRILAAVAIAAIVAGAFEPFYVRIFLTDARQMHAYLTELPYRKLPGWRAFLTGVDARTPPGARIAIALPYGQWEEGYGYGYYRASFLLPGKQVVPLLELHADRLAPQHLNDADYIASWRGEPRVDGFTTIWRTPDGALLRRNR